MQRADEIDRGGYFCHTSADTCVDDIDCPLTATWGDYCAYSHSATAWTCHPFSIE
jgi:hypothetical protein